MELWGLEESTFRKNQSQMSNSTQRAPLKNGLISALHKGLWQGPIQPTKPWVSKLEISNGGGPKRSAWGIKTHNLERPEGWTAINKMKLTSDEVQHLGVKSPVHKHTRWRASKA